MSPLHDGKNVLWLRGPAGCGKTAVITTLIEELSDAHHLGGNFFFEKGKDRDPSFLIQTLAAQLASSDKPLMCGIASRIRANKSVLQGSLEDQFEQLLLRPLLAHTPDRPVVFLVDGLEWCGKGQEVGERDILKKVLRLLVEGSARFPPNVRLLFDEEDESVRELLGSCDRVVEFEMAEAEAAGPLSVSSA
jgi:GTPase SAR1 family protein